MGKKLVRNTSSKESREWWAAVRSAAASAPKLTYEPSSRPDSTKRPTTATNTRDSRKKRSPAASV